MPRSKNTIRVVGILLVYYPEYLDSAIRNFNRFLKSLSPNLDLVLVNNGSSIISNEVDITAIIQGNNYLREFSAWDTGLKYCEENGLLKSCDLLVFANDTFCHHNKFGPFTRFAFKKIFKNIMDNPDQAAMAGEKFRLSLPYTLNGLTSESWISTYLFAFNRSAFKEIKTLIPATPIEDFYLSGKNDIKFSNLMSENLQKHIEKWLSGSGVTTWRGVEKTEESGIDNLPGKVNSIICEKHLSAFAKANDINLIDVFDKKPFLLLRKIESLMNKINKLLGNKKPDIYSN